MQSRKSSLLEAVINTLVGFIVAVIAQELIFPLFGINISFDQNIYIALIFTVLSIIRSYVLRRIFNYFHRVNKG